MKSHKAGAFISELTVECGVTKKKKKKQFRKYLLGRFRESIQAAFLF